MTEQQTKLTFFTTGQTKLSDFDKLSEKERRFDLKLQIDKARRMMFLRTKLLPPEDSFEDDIQRDFNRFYKDINMGAIKNRDTLRAEIRRVGMNMQHENLRSNNRNFLKNAGENYIKHTKSLMKYFVTIVQGKDVLRDVNSGRFISTKNL